MRGARLIKLREFVNTLDKLVGERDFINLVSRPEACGQHCHAALHTQVDLIFAHPIQNYCGSVLAVVT